MLKNIIQNFPKQLDYEPVIENIANFHKKDKFTPPLKRTGGKQLAKGQSFSRAGFIVCGMGGSNLAAGIIKSWKPKSDIIIHRDYGLPEMEEVELKNRLIILSSYSGTTEETISAFTEAQSRGLSALVITTGGRLLELAQESKTPYIQMPKTVGNPRFAIGYSIKATLKAMGEESIIDDVSHWAESFTDGCEQAGKELADKLQDKMPLIYSSGNNAGLARYWKISFNETAKLPAFYNFLPELNHNEMVGFSSNPALEKDDKETFGQWPVLFKGGDKFAFVFLNDPDDEPRIQKRMVATQRVFEDRGFTVLNVDLTGPSLWHKSFAGILTAMWTSYFFAEYYGVDPEDISMIEEFKKSLVS